MELTAADAALDRVRRLREARATGRVEPRDLDWVIDVAAARVPQMVTRSPAERLAVALSEEVDRWMRHRGVTGRTVGCSRRSLVRCLKGQNVRLDTVADIADALGCDVRIAFEPRGA